MTLWGEDCRGVGVSEPARELLQLGVRWAPIRGWGGNYLRLPAARVGFMAVRAMQSVAQGPKLGRVPVHGLMLCCGHPEILNAF